jgi:hypothetical protein
LAASWVCPAFSCAACFVSSAFWDAVSAIWSNGKNAGSSSRLILQKCSEELQRRERGDIWEQTRWKNANNVKVWCEETRKNWDYIMSMEAHQNRQLVELDQSGLRSSLDFAQWHSREVSMCRSSILHAYHGSYLPLCMYIILRFFFLFLWGLFLFNSTRASSTYIP